MIKAKVTASWVIGAELDSAHKARNVGRGGVERGKLTFGT